MRIKYKGAKNSIEDSTVNLSYWQSEYSKNDKYLDYEFYDVPEIVDLYKLNPETQRLEFNRCVFDHEANHIINKDRRNYSKKPHDKSRLNEYLMPVKKNQSSSRSFPLFKYIKWLKPKTKFDTQSIRHITIVVLMIISILVMIYIAYKQGAFN
jgi:hypothetical protein